MVPGAMVSTKGGIRSHQVRMISSLRDTTRSSTALSELPLRSNLASMIGSDSSANGWCSSVSMVRWRKRATAGVVGVDRCFLSSSVLSMKSACPCPAGDHSTRQWLTRSGMVLPPSFDSRTNEFSPVITGSCGSTSLGSAIRRRPRRCAGRARRRRRARAALPGRRGCRARRSPSAGSRTRSPPCAG